MHLNTPHLSTLMLNVSINVAVGVFETRKSISRKFLSSDRCNLHIQINVLIDENKGNTCSAQGRPIVGQISSC